MARNEEKNLECDNVASSNILLSPPQFQLNSRQEALLKQIEDIEPNLKLYEVVSILFLLHRNATKAFRDLELFLSGVKSNLVSKWCREAISHDENWESKFYESLFLIKNYQVLKQFDIEAVNAVHQFNHNYLIPDIRLELYRICENIIGSELVSLLKQMEETDFRVKDYTDYLEMYMLKWISEGKITIDGENDVMLLINSLNKIDRGEFAQKLLHYQHSNSSIEELVEKIVHLDDDYAIIDPTNVGLCVIINQKNFTRDPRNPLLELKQRVGTEKDCESLKKMLRTFKFDVEIVNDVISDNLIDVIRDKVDKFFKPSHSIFLLIILSHGHKGVIYGTDSRPVQIVNIDLCLHVPQLQGKPKIIIIQACQGDYYLKASKVETDAPVTVREWPKDTLFCMATIPYFASYRHAEKGTWYIQTLCNVFLKYPDDNVYSLLTKVNRELNNEPVFGTEQQIRSRPEFQSRLEKNLYFKRKSNAV